MSDTFNVTAAYDKPDYLGGDVIKATISGFATVTEETESQIGPLVIPIIIPKTGSKATVDLGAIMAKITTVASEPVTIDPDAPIIDSSPTPRAWVISEDKMSLSAVA